MDFFKNLNLKELLQNFSAYVGFDNTLDVIRAIVDISIVAFVLYKLIVLLKETRAWQLLKGLIIIVIAAGIAKVLGLITFSYILNYILTFSAFAMVVIFQPELRRGLEKIGSKGIKDIVSFNFDDKKLQISAVIEEVVKACTELSENFVGALIVIERNVRVGGIINTGTEIDSLVSGELLINIFTPNTPLHDGAVIIRDNKIKTAGSFLPLTDNPEISRDLGTRHRAAIGITEISDSLAVVVSEESGKISFAINGTLARNLNGDALRKILSQNLIQKQEEKAAWKIGAFWKRKTK